MAEDDLRDQLRNAEVTVALLERVLEQVGSVVWTTRPPYERTETLSHSARRVLGITGDGFDLEDWARMVHQDDRAGLLAALDDARHRGAGESGPYRLHHPERGTRWLRTRISVLDPATGMIGGVTEDVTEVVEARRETEEVSQALTHFVQSSDDVFYLADPTLTRLRFLGGGPGGRLVGSDADTEDAAAWMDVVHPDDRERVQRSFAQIVTGKPDRVQAEYRVRHRDGDERWLWTRLSPILDHDGEMVAVAGLSTDVTERKRDADRLQELNLELERRVAERTATLQAAVAESRALAHELDHRVRNNLQVISSLVFLSGRHSDAAARRLADDLRSRIRTLAQVHEHLSRTGGPGRVDLARYLRAVTGGLPVALGRTDVEIVLEVPDGLQVAVARAGLIGLIVNELVTNALRHAFPEGRAGRVLVRCTAAPAGPVLEVADDGIGFPEDAEPGVGTTLIDLLSGQLGAVIRRDASGGARVVLELDPV